MCMQNVNATLVLASEVDLHDNGVYSIQNVFDGIVPKRQNNECFLEDFVVMLNCCVLLNIGREDDQVKLLDNDNGLRLGKTYEFMIRMTHVGSGKGVSLRRFEVTIEKEDVNIWCKGVYEFKRVVRIARLDLPKGLGNYAIKLLIREKTANEDEPWVTQSMCGLVVGATS